MNDVQGKPRYIECPVCGGTDTLNVNVLAGVVDLCVRCKTDLHSDVVFHEGSLCPTCGERFCYCKRKEELEEASRG